MHKRPSVADATDLKQWASLVSLGKSVFTSDPLDGFLTVTLMAIRSLTSGIGLLLIIPMLGLLSIPVLDSKQSALSQYLQSLFISSHVSIQLWHVLLAFILILTLVASAGFFEEIICSRWQEQHQNQLRERIYKSLLLTRWTYLIQKKNSDLLHSITTQLQATWLCHFQCLQLINQAFLASVYIVLSCLLSWKMTLVAVAAGAGSAVMMLPLQRLTARSARFFITHNQALFQVFYEQLNALKMIKSSNAERACLSAMLGESEALSQQTRYFIKINALKKWLYSCINVIVFSALLYTAIVKLELPVGSLLLLLLVFSRLMPLVSSMQQSWQQLVTHLPAWSDLQILQQECHRHQEAHLAGPNTPVTFEHAIRFDKVSFHYHPGQTAPLLRDFSARIMKNTTTVLSGPSGAGKTSIADLLVGLLEPVSGAIYIDQQCLGSDNMARWRQSVAYVTQEAFLFNTSLRNNLQMFCKDATEEDMWRALDSVKALEFVKKLEHGLDTLMGDRGIRLSGGERQRIALARALLMKPQLLILDESTNALDEQHIRHIQQSLANLRGKLTILIISHQPDMSAHADQLITLNTSHQTAELQPC